MFKLLFMDFTQMGITCQQSRWFAHCMSVVKKMWLKKIT